jgi:hypothetical protein
VAPGKVTYEILATYEPVNFKQIYSINIYDNIFVLQDINVISSNVELGGF